uniref:Telomeric repeat-binding factor 2-interacting protein 1 n=1 Tax=Iconisemion striatum TaxID=60296 RepID=A0A1A7XSY9_9TELE
MPSKQQDPAPSISPVLFLNEDGEPMSFFLRPGPIKRKLQPLISAGGGMLCKIQQPGSILLITPEERRSVPESAAHWYVSTQFIHDSIEKGEQLNIEDYKLDPEVTQKQDPGLNKSKDSSTKTSGGRMPYTPEEDAAILHYVSKRKKETGGNRLWLEMEKKRVTNHSWQSMRYRYKEQLKARQSEDLEVEVREEDDETSKMEANQDCDADKSSCEADIAHPPAADSDLTQIDVQTLAAGCTLENKDTRAAVTAEEEERRDQEMDEQEFVKATTSPSTQTENSNLQLRTAEGSESEDEPQTAVSLHKLNMHKNSPNPAAQPKATPGSTSKSPKEKLEASPRLEQPQLRKSRRQLGLEALSSSPSSPEPFAKKLRSSSSSAERATSSPQPSKKTKSTRESAHQSISKDQTPLKRDRGRTVGAEGRPEQSGSVSEGEPEKSGSDSESKLAQADENNPEPQKGGKRKEKRARGILELARKEFEDDSESDDGPDHPETAEPLLRPRDTPAGPTPAQSHPDTRPHPQDDGVEGGRVAGDDCVSDADPSDAAPAEKNCSEPVGASSKAHLFIFDSESQEDGSQFVVEPSAAQSKPQPTEFQDTPFSLTQVQLEEDKRRIRDLIDQTNQDLVSVTKALLKTSGDFSAALELLLNPSSVSALIWDPRDDPLLLSADPDVRQKLLEKYGEGNLAKRTVFLEVDG